MHMLYSLLASLFTADEFRRWIHFGHYAEIVIELPGEAASYAATLEAALLALDRRGEIDGSFFDRLSQAQPLQREAIADVAMLWTDAVSTPSQQTPAADVIPPLLAVATDGPWAFARLLRREMYYESAWRAAVRLDRFETELNTSWARRPQDSTWMLLAALLASESARVQLESSSTSHVSAALSTAMKAAAIVAVLPAGTAGKRAATAITKLSLLVCRRVLKDGEWSAGDDYDAMATLLTSDDLLVLADEAPEELSWARLELAKVYLGSRHAGRFEEALNMLLDLVEAEPRSLAAPLAWELAARGHLRFGTRGLDIPRMLLRGRMLAAGAPLMEYMIDATMAEWALGPEGDPATAVPLIAELSTRKVGHYQLAKLRRLGVRVPDAAP
jgi:hypothetical protein